MSWQERKRPKKTHPWPPYDSRYLRLVSFTEMVKRAHPIEDLPKFMGREYDGELSRLSAWLP
jgi:hypothetical protein